MATSTFPTLKIKKEDIEKLLNDGPMKGFNRLAFQFYRRQGDKFTLVAQLLDERRKKMDNTPVFFIEEDENSSDTYTTDADVMFLQHELTKNDVIKLSDHGKKDIILKPRKIQVNPDGVTYDGLNPCPPAIPPAG